jgi:hypothetical protein
MKVVIAGSYKQYINWLHKNKFSPDEYQYVNRIEQVWGLKIKKIIYVGTFWDNLVYYRYHSELKDRLMTTNFVRAVLTGEKYDE